MIKVNELRIGNWVTEEVLCDAPVSGIGKDSVLVTIKHMDMASVITDQEYRLLLSNIDPILITHGILLKAGAVGDGLGKEYYLGGIILKEGDHKTWEYRIETVWIGAIQSVHQLQNLYFALTGEELEIKL